MISANSACKEVEPLLLPDTEPDELPDPDPVVKPESLPVPEPLSESDPLAEPLALAEPETPTWASITAKRSCTFSRLVCTVLSWSNSATT